MYLTDLTSVICWNRALIRVGAAVVVAVVAIAAFAIPAYAQSGGDGGAYDDAEAQAIDRMLMCPVCPAQTIDQTEVPLAKQMRAQVRELLASGATRKEVLAWFSAPERYGPGVLAEPPRSGFYLIAWIVPGVVVVAALGGGLLTLRAMRRRGDDTDTAADANAGVAVAGVGASASAGESDDLQPYLDAVDRDLALDTDTLTETDTDTEHNDG